MGHVPTIAAAPHGLAGLQENDSKRARAEKKAADEIKARLAKEKEIEGLTQQLEELRAEKERMHEVLEKNMRWVPALG